MSEMTAEELFRAAIREHRAGRLDDALALIRRAIAINPRSADYLTALGVVLASRKLFDVAIDAYCRALELKPDNPDALNNLGVALKEMGDLPGAISSLRKALQLRPNFAAAHNNLGAALKASGELAAAIGAYRQALSLEPNYVEALANLGQALSETGQFEQSIDALRRAVAIAPNWADGFICLGNAYQGCGQLNEARQAVERALMLDPQNADACVNLAAIYQQRREVDPAIDLCHRALALRPQLPQALNNLGRSLLDAGLIDEAVASYRESEAIAPARTAGSNLLFALHLHPDSDPNSLRAAHARWNWTYAAALAPPILSFPNDRNADRTLRIGFVSPDFHNHPVGRFILPLLEHHDRTQFEAICYSDSHQRDDTSRRLRACADGWRDAAPLSDDRLAQLVRIDRIDILVDLALHTEGNRLLVFARKPAPIQATYLAYCSSSGLTTMDYRLTDPYLDPPGPDEPVYCERLIRIKSYWCYSPPPESSPVGPPPALRNGFIIFGCLNSFQKVNGSLLQLWSHILQKIPNSRLMLHSYEGSHRSRVLDLFAAERINPERITFVGPQPTPNYFQQYNAIDIALDTFPYTGGTTTCDALWMGVPVVTRAGNTAVSRGGVSILSNAGLPEYITCTPEQYVQAAIDLARDVEKRNQLRITLRQRMQESRLMDASSFVRDMERAFRQMWQTWCDPKAAG